MLVPASALPTSTWQRIQPSKQDYRRHFSILQLSSQLDPERN